MQHPERSSWSNGQFSSQRCPSEEFCAVGAVLCSVTDLQDRGLGANVEMDPERQQ